MRYLRFILPAIAFILVLFLFLKRPGTVSGDKENKTTLDGTTICVATDIHYIAPELTDDGKYFTELIENADGKFMQYCEEITDSFVKEMITIKPEVVILSGDLTFNGAMASHEGLAQKLKSVEDAGIRVLVIPGNHDLNSRGAACFKGDGYTLVDNVSAEDFSQIYRDFGYEEALARDESSLSYVAELNSGARVLMIDVNTKEAPGELKDETLEWIKVQLEEARKSGNQVIAVSHQNLIPHNPMFTDGFVMGQYEKLCELYEKYGVRCNLSGHMHIQNIAESENGLKDIATSSLMVAPCQYGVIEFKGDKATYHTEELEFEHAEDAGRFFKDTSTRMLKRSIAEPNEEICSFFSEVNSAYFSGRKDKINWNESACEDITKESPFVGLYLQSVYDDGFCDDTKCEF